MLVQKKLIVIFTIVSGVKLLSLQFYQVAPALAQQPSRSFCEEYARDYARRNSRGRTLTHAARGAAGGAIVGSIFGDAGLGAAIGAGAEGFRGGINQSRDYDYLYRIAFDDCMNGKVQ